MRKPLACSSHSPVSHPRGPAPCNSESATSRHPTDGELYASLLERADSASWRVFLLRFDGAIRSGIAYAARSCRICLCDDDRDEIRASFFVRLLANDMQVLRSYDPARGKAPAGWIAMLAERFAFDWVRARRRLTKLHELDGAHTERDDTVTPESLLAQKELILRIRRARDSLPERQREMYDLYFEQNLDVRDVAFRMGTSLQTVHSCRSKIVERLLKALQSQAESPLSAPPPDHRSER